MADFVFKLPDIGEGTAEAEIVAWHVKPGDQVTEDRRLVDVMTDKAIVEMTSPVCGVIAAIHGRVNEKVAVGSPLVEFRLDQGASHKDESSDPKSGEVESERVVASVTHADAAKSLEASRSGVTELPRTPPPKQTLASPAVRRRAYEQGVALQFIQGTGPAGRVTHQDLEDFFSGTARTSPSCLAMHGRKRGKAADVIEEVKIVGLRRKIAERMQEAKWRIPHITYVEEIDLTELEALRQHMNDAKRDDQPKLTLLPFFIRALVRALPHHPSLNARFDDDAGVLLRYEAVHCGIATRTPAGLLVPVVRHAGERDLWNCAAEIARLAAAAREGKAKRDELSGSTITITSLGALGGLSATHVINRPEVAIVGPNKLIERPVVKNGAIVVRRMMNLSSSFDHRIVDGHEAAEFVQRLKSLLECPAMLFVDAS